MRYLYVKFNENEEKPETVRDLLKKMFSNNGSFGCMTAIESYSNRKLTNIQCAKNRYRSFDDVFRIVNTYFPDTSSEEIIKTLLTLKVNNINNNSCNLMLSYCSDIRKPVMYYSDITMNESLTSWSGGMRGYSKYTWKELLRLAGFNINQEVFDYAKEKI